MHFRHGQYATAMQRDNHFHYIKLFEKTVEHQLSRQVSRHRDPNEGSDANHAYILKTSAAHMDWSCLTVIRMPDERLSKRVLQRITREKTF